MWGMDSTGKPFSQTARTVDISGQGARLAGITGPKQLGDVIGVQHGDQKARFQVVWVGANGTAEQGQIGIACLDAGRCIWAEALEGAPDQFGQGPEILRPGAPAAGPAAAAGGDPGRTAPLSTLRVRRRVNLGKECAPFHMGETSRYRSGRLLFGADVPAPAANPGRICDPGGRSGDPWPRHGADRSSIGGQRHRFHANEGRRLAATESAHCPPGQSGASRAAPARGSGG